MMKVSVPLHLLQAQVQKPLVVSLPLAAFQSAPVTNLEKLRSRLKKIGEFSSGGYYMSIYTCFYHSTCSFLFF